MRLLLEERWCADRCGCFRWDCQYRVDPDEEVCNYFCRSASKSCVFRNAIMKEKFEKRVRERAYFIWKETGCRDSIANYFKAEKEILYPKQIYPLISD